MHNSTYCGIPVYSPDKLSTETNIKIIISNTYMGTRAKIVKSLQDMGFVENKDFTYIEIVFSIFNWKFDNKIVSQYAEISTTTFCTLNCKNCTAYMPYIEKRRHLSIDDLIKDCDTYFKCIDYVGRFRVLGGEPLTYPKLIELIRESEIAERNDAVDFSVIKIIKKNIQRELLKSII